MDGPPPVGVMRQSSSPRHASPFLGPGVQHRLAYSGEEVRAAALTWRKGEEVLLRIFGSDEKKEEDGPAAQQEGAQPVLPAEDTPPIAAQTPGRAAGVKKGMWSW
jgi:hypothetical protein